MEQKTNTPEHDAQSDMQEHGPNEEALTQHHNSTKQTIANKAHAITHTAKQTAEDHRFATAAIAATATAGILGALYYVNTKHSDQRTRGVRERLRDAHDSARNHADRAKTAVTGAYQHTKTHAQNARAHAASGEHSAYGDDAFVTQEDFEDILYDAKQAGKHVLVMMAERLRATDTTAESQQAIKDGLRDVAKGALHGAVHGTRVSAAHTHA